MPVADHSKKTSGNNGTVETDGVHFASQIKAREALRLQYDLTHPHAVANGIFYGALTFFISRYFDDLVTFVQWIVSNV